MVSALLPPGALIERPECSSPGHAADLLATLTGSGRGRVVLLGHLDTVVAHAEHRPLEDRGERLVGSGAVDMKGGIALALGVMRALAAVPEAFAEIGLLAVNDEEWRTGGFDHGPRLAGYDACLCFEAGELGPGGEEGVVARRKAAATMRVTARGLAAHSGSAPERGRNALLGLGEAARRIAALNDPGGAERLTAVPTVLQRRRRLQRRPRRGRAGLRSARRQPRRVRAAARRPAWRDRRGRARGGARPPLAGDGHPRAGHRAPARPGDEAARATDRRHRAWRGERRQSRRSPRGADGGRARSPRRPRPQPRGVRPPSSPCTREPRSRSRWPLRRSGWAERTRARDWAGGVPLGPGRGAGRGLFAVRELFSVLRAGAASARAAV